MPGIPIINQTVNTPSGDVLRAHEFVSPISDKTFDSLQKGLDTVGHMIEHKNEQDAKMYAGQIAADANAQFEQRLTDMKAKAAPGAPDFTPSIMKEFDDYRSKAIENAPTPSSKHFVEQHMLVLQKSLQSNAISFEAGARLGLRTDTFKKSADDWAKVVAANPTEDKVSLALNTLRETMPDVGPDGKSTLSDYAEKTIRTAAWASLAQNNPALAKRVIDGAFGKMQASGNQFADLQVDPAGQDTSTWGARHDGTKKGTGYLGVLRTKDGGVATEMGVTVNIDGKDREIPLIVPTLSRSEVDSLLSVPQGKKPWDVIKNYDDIERKAVDFAKQRMSQGKPFFADAGESPQYKKDLIPAANLKAVERFAPIIDQASVASGVDANFLRRQLAVESGGNPDAVNNADIRVTGKTSIGIAQFQPETAKRYGIDPTKPDQAIYGQSRYMADLLKMFGGDYAKAAAGYNWGEGNVQKVVSKWGDKWRDHLPASTKDYLDKIGTPADRASMSQNDKPSGFSGMIGMTPIGELLHWQGQAEQQLNRVSQDQQTQMRLDVQNAEAQARAGIAPTGQNRTEADFLTAFKDPIVAQSEFARYAQARNTAIAVSGMQGRSSDELLAIANANTEARADDPNLAVTVSNQAIRQNAAAAILKARSSDPWAYAMQQGQFGTSPVDFSSKEFPDVLRSRAAALPGMMQQYGTGPVLLTDTERQSLTARLSGLPGDQRIDLLKQIRGSIADGAVYSTLMQSVRPDSPVTALAGSIAGLNKGAVKIGSGTLSTDEIARRIAVGEDLLNKGKGDKQSDGGKGSAFPMPKEQQLKQEFDDAVGTSYAGFPEAYQHSYQAYRAYYASQIAAKGKMNVASDGVDSQISREAIDAATGGMTRWGSNSWGLGGSKLILPYGMPAADFKDAVSKQWNQIAKDNGITKTAASDIGLVPTGINGRYRVQSGASWLPDKHGNPIVIDVGNQ